MREALSYQSWKCLRIKKGLKRKFKRVVLADRPFVQPAKILCDTVVCAASFVITILLFLNPAHSEKEDRQAGLGGR